MTDWQDMIVGDRMVVDDQFADRVRASQFTRQQWGLLMTATTFEIERPSDEGDARLVADTSQLPAVLPELEKVASMGPAGRPTEPDDADGGGGLFGSFLESLGFGGAGPGDAGVDEETREAAERLLDAYARELQTHLEDEGRWEEVRTTAAAAGEPDPSAE